MSGSEFHHHDVSASVAAAATAFPGKVFLPSSKSTMILE